MPKMIVRSGRSAVLAALLILSPAPALFAQAAATAQPGAVVQVVPFKAYAKDGVTLMYTGQYRAERQGSQLREVQEYVSAQGVPTQRVETLYDTEAQKPLFYDSHNLKTGARAVIRWDKGQLNYEVWKSKEDSSKTGSEEAGTLLVWPNLIHVLAQEWDPLTSGQPQERQLFIASRTMTVNVKLSQEELPPGGDPKAAARFLVEPTSWVIRALGSPAHLELAREAPHRMLKYQAEGIAPGPDGKPLELIIVFDWSKAT